MSKPHSHRRKATPASGQPPRAAQGQSSRIVLLTTLATTVGTAGLLGGSGSDGFPDASASDGWQVTRETQTTTAGSTWSKCRVAAMAGVARAVAKWQSQAVLKDVTINGPTASGGSVAGPALGPVIEQTMAEAGVPPAMAKVFAGPVSSAWSAWASSLRVPGMNWYPSFASFPGPVAPPSPNVPAPLMALGGNPYPLSALSLKAAIRKALGDRTSDRQALAAVDGFADDFAARFAKYHAAAMVTNVVGTGPVPTFAPPYVPVGPVVGGKGTMKPGGFAGTWPAN